MADTNAPVIELTDEDHAQAEGFAGQAAPEAARQEAAEGQSPEELEPAIRQRMIVGKLGEAAFARHLAEAGRVATGSEDMWTIYSGMREVDLADFTLPNGELIDVKTMSRETHSELRVGEEGFLHHPSDLYVAARVREPAEPGGRTRQVEILGYTPREALRTQYRVVEGKKHHYCGIEDLRPIGELVERFPETPRRTAAAGLLEEVARANATLEEAISGRGPDRWWTKTSYDHWAQDLERRVKKQGLRGPEITRLRRMTEAQRKAANQRYIERRMRGAERDPVLRDLDDHQRRAVVVGEEAQCVLAGAGTGKTHTLIAKIRDRLAQGVPPTRVAVVTFTNKAANEIRERLADQVERPHDAMYVGTIHGLAARVLGRTPSSSWEQSQAEPDERTREELLDEICSSERLEPPDNAIKEATAALRNGEAPRRFSEVLVDECQDINATQAEFIRALGGHEDPGRGIASLCLIGDDWQSIYGFNGGSPEHLRGFMADPPGGVYERTDLVKSWRFGPKRAQATRNWSVKDPEASNRVMEGAGEQGQRDTPIEVQEATWTETPDRPVRREQALEELIEKIGREKQGSDARPKLLVLGRRRRDVENRQRTEEDATDDILRRWTRNLPERLEYQREDRELILIAAISMAKRNKEYGLNHEQLLKKGAECGVELDLETHTVHSAKGLEADHVAFFPGEGDWDQEDRRIWYVAMTRARERCVVLPPIPWRYGKGKAAGNRLYEELKADKDGQYQIELRDFRDGGGKETGTTAGEAAAAAAPTAPEEKEALPEASKNDELGGSA